VQIISADRPERLSSLDRQERLTPRQVFVIGVSAAAQMIDFLDFFLISFVLAFVARPWHLTVLQTTIVLLSSGIGAVLGSFICGNLADRYGRRPMFLATIGLFSLCTGALALTPEGSWTYLAVFRFFVGFGATGMYSVNIPLLQEFMPINRRGWASGIVTTFIPVGVMVGSIVVAVFGATIGWRGLFVFGALLGMGLLLVSWFVPESPVWLLNRKKAGEARRSMAWALNVRDEAVDFGSSAGSIPERRARLSELFRYPRSVVVSWVGVLGAQVAYYGLTLWAPVLLVLILNTTPSHAAFLLIFANIGDVCGRVIFANLSERAGRRLIGILQGFVGATLLVTTALLAHQVLGDISVFWLLLIPTYFFVSGGFAVTVPYAAEIWPSHLRATGLGSAYGIGSLGKIIGPLGLGLLLGSSNVLSPTASLTSVVPAFVYLAAWILATGIVFLAFAFETRGKSLSEIETELAGRPRDLAPT